ncbi:hypothetical protein [Winogradskyella sp. A2]|uniref:hypothetical protein n=1 Tax=Winogradskyella sp. A2 TaxID=3366944 RepID=UPI00398C64EC
MIILTLNSCSLFKEKGIEMEIKNNSNKPITDVEFTTSERLEVIKIDRIQPNESVTEFLSMVQNKSDGFYWLTFTRSDGKKEISGGGYYTNGESLDKWVKFEIKSDTTFYKFSGTGY